MLRMTRLSAINTVKPNRKHKNTSPTVSRLFDKLSYKLK